jgi:ribosomal protein S18 acetylase RimI-like enzyme
VDPTDEPASGLDDPVWASLTGPHAHLARELGRARAYADDVTPFVGLADPGSPESWSDLAALVGPGRRVALAPAVTPPHGWQVVWSGAGVQMVAGKGLVTSPWADVELGDHDVPEMLDLVARTDPGPFLARTHVLGTYLGVRVDGRLVSMAGERLHPPGGTEISAVCTDPAFRGRGLAARLVTALAHGIRARGELPFLHAVAGNTPAIRLYASLGFVVRREVTFVALRSPTASGVRVPPDGHPG